VAWIKMRTDLRSDPAVISLSELTGLDVPGVIGRLHAVWSWADSVSRDGHVHSVTPNALLSHIDRDVMHLGFAMRLVEVGWLRVLGDGLVFPNFDRHMSESAKKRALATERQSRKRRDTVSRTKRDISVTREEKKRVDKTPVVPFDEFWGCVVRKVARRDAEKAWGRLTSDERVAALNGMRKAAQSEQWQRDGGKFVPYPATWLNGRRWEDDIGPAVVVASPYAGTKEWLACADCGVEYFRIVGQPDVHRCQGVA